MKSNRGFSLLELLIVVAIILIIATIAVPSLRRSRQSANEAPAVASLRTVNTAEVQYISNHQGNYGDLPNMVTAGVVDVAWSGVVIVVRHSTDPTRAPKGLSGEPVR